MQEIVSTYNSLEAGFVQLSSSKLTGQHSHTYLAIADAISENDLEWVPEAQLTGPIKRFLENPPLGASVPMESDHAKDPRSILAELVKTYGWLERRATQTGQYEYRKTTELTVARQYLNELSTSYFSLTGSTMDLVLGQVGLLAATLSGDRKALIETQIRIRDEAQDKINRLAEGEEDVVASPRDIESQINLVRSLISKFTVDARKLVKQLDDKTQVLTDRLYEQVDFRGYIIQEFLEKTSDILSTTDEGKSYRDAMELYRDTKKSTLLTANMTSIHLSKRLNESQALSVAVIDDEWRKLNEAATEIEDANMRGWDKIAQNIAQINMASGFERSQALRECLKACHEFSKEHKGRTRIEVEPLVGKFEQRRIVDKPPIERKKMRPDPMDLTPQGAYAEKDATIRREPTRYEVFDAFFKSAESKAIDGVVDIARAFNDTEVEFRSAESLVHVLSTLARGNIAEAPAESIWSTTDGGIETTWKTRATIVRIEDVEEAVSKEREIWS